MISIEVERDRASLGRFGRLREDPAGLREDLITHPIYSRIDDLNRLRDFMQIHVFAVWDFMSLVKRPQMEFTSTRLPWIPPAISQAARFANEVVLGEETDLSSDGKALSHFELYLRAMKEVGADSSMIRLFLERLSRGMPYRRPSMAWRSHAASGSLSARR